MFHKIDMSFNTMRNVALHKRNDSDSDSIQIYCFRYINIHNIVEAKNEIFNMNYYSVFAVVLYKGQESHFTMRQRLRG